MLPRTVSPRASSRVYLSLGTNLGDREEHLRAALAALPDHGLQIEGVSPVYETAPQDVPDQPWFLNLVVEASTLLNAENVLQALLAIERAGGRERVGGFARGPRPIDIDLLLYDSVCIRSPDLEVPHSRMTYRRFVLQPLVDLNPKLRHPETGQLFSDLLALTENQPVSFRLPDRDVLPDPAFPPARQRSDSDPST